MDRMLNKKNIFLLLVFNYLFIFPQSSNLNITDYKEAKQFEKYNIRRNIISSWQINQLKQGAIVVRLKTNKKLIELLLKQGNNELALQKQLEQFAINKNTMAAFKDNLNFCKLYFINSNSSDSLLKGFRTGIFLDSALKIDASIIMDEKFYLIAERDYAYNSSIGFVTEDSAKYMIEKGNPVREMSIVIKNKYGHQLKKPFPYLIKEKNFMDTPYDFPIMINSSNTIFFNVNKTFLQDLKSNKTQLYSLSHSNSQASLKKVKVKKQFTYEKLSIDVELLNDNLTQFYKENPNPEKNKYFSDLKAFLY